MLIRFSIYGFLKNQRFFEPFLFLAFIEKGLSFTAIGWLIAYRELLVNIAEIPSGALADIWGRRRSMLLSFSAYTLSFLLFGWAQDLIFLYLAMTFYAIGEAFRTGTHKAMIFTWLRSRGEEHLRTRVYGYTRSWSKIGSAVSVVLGSALVYFSNRYQYVFYWAALPCIASIFNLWGYPAYLEGEQGVAQKTRMLGHLKQTAREIIKSADIRRLMAESMGFGGVFHSVKDYLQPLLSMAAVSMSPLFLGAGVSGDIQATTLLLAPTYVVLFASSAIASRNAHRMGEEERAARRLWFFAVVSYATILIFGFFGWAGGLIACFVALHMVQNMWRPILVSRFDRISVESQGATILSVESQSRRVATMILSPLIGFLVDQSLTPPANPLWPIGLIGLAVSLGFVSRRSRPSKT